MRETNSSRISKHNVGPDLDPDRLISLVVFLKEFVKADCENKYQHPTKNNKKHANLPKSQRVRLTLSLLSAYLYVQ